MPENKTVKSYRVTGESLKVGNSVRQFGDLVPEAENWPNLRAYMNAGQVEKVYVSESELAEHKKKFAKSDSASPKSEKRTASKKTIKKRKVVKKSAGRNSGNATERPDITEQAV